MNLTSDVQIIIPMAGKSQRFFDAGYKHPKGLIEFFGLPMIGHILKMFKDFEDVLVIVNDVDEQNFHLDEMISKLHPTVKTVKISQHSFGPSYSILKSSPYINLDKKTIVHYCDFSGVWDPIKTVDLLSKWDGVLVTFTGFHPVQINGTKFAYGKVNSDGQLLEIKEKGSFTSKPEEENASSGIYGFSSGQLMIRSIEEQINSNLQINGEYYTSLTLAIMLQNKNQIATQSMEFFFGWGTPEDLEVYIYYLSFCKSISKEYSYNVPIEHNGIILAAGKSSRLRLKDQKPKQSKLILNEIRLLDFSRKLISEDKKTYLVCTEEIYPENIWKLPVENFKVLTHATESQLASVQIGLDMIQNKEIPITFLASDNIVIIDKKEFSELATGKTDLIVWTTGNFPFGKVSPDQYSWVKTNDDNIIENALYKEAPIDLRNWKIMTGNFTFRNHTIASQLIEFWESENNIDNREPILDDLVGIAIKNGFSLKAFDVTAYVTLGRDLENRVFDFFSKVYEFEHKI